MNSTIVPNTFYQFKNIKILDLRKFKFLNQAKENLKLTGVNQNQITEPILYLLWSFRPLVQARYEDFDKQP